METFQNIISNSIMSDLERLNQIDTATLTRYGFYDKRKKSKVFKKSIFRKNNSNKLKPSWVKKINQIESHQTTSLSKIQRFVRDQKTSKINRASRLNVQDITNPNSFNIREYKITAYITPGQDINDLLFIDNLVVFMNSRITYKHRLIINDTSENGLIVSTPIRQGRITNEQVWALISLLAQSGGYVSIYNLEFTAQIISEATWLGSKCTSEQVPMWIKNMRSVVKVINDDELCGQRCLVLGSMTPQQRKDIVRPRKVNAFTKRAEKMAEDIEHNGSMRFKDFEKFTNKFPEYTVKIFDGVYCNFTVGNGEKPIHLFYDTKIKHYHFIANPNGFVNGHNGCNYKFCDKCNSRHIINSKCKCENKVTICNVCAKETKYSISLNEANPLRAFITCCKFQWRDDIEIEKPKDAEPCFKCRKWYSKRYNTDADGVHRCGRTFCRTCNKDVSIKHRCFIPKLEPGAKTLEKWNQLANVWSFDMEAEIHEGKAHHVTLIIAKNRYTGEVVDFKGDEAMSCFADFALKQKDTTWIAHNARGYDTWLLNRHLKQKTGTRPNKIVLAGAKIMFLKYGSVTFIDSLNHIQSKLEDLPATFGLDEGKFKKGFYPYTFNTSVNRNYIGKMPEKKYFDPEGMSVKKRDEFYEWYDPNYIWDHAKETYEYCLSDVEILHQALNVYSKEAFELNQLDPLHFPTIASYCMKLYKWKFYNPKCDEEKICVLTKDEYDFCKRGFFGGRTETIKLSKKWSKQDLNRGVGGSYQDVQSLYPTVQFYDELPIGAPIHKEYGEMSYLENADIIKENYGFFEVDIQCNKSLYCPVLPAYEICGGDKKLCFSSVDKEKCVYHSTELRNAINHGYRITRIYKSICFNTSKDIFKDYVRTFLEIKVNCGGKPDLSDEKYAEWVRQHEIRFGFTPKPNKNKGKKAIAKLCLNSLWGKFSQKIDQCKTEYIKPERWWKMLKQNDSGLIDIKEVYVDDYDTLYVKYSDKREFSNEVLKSTNLALGASVTACARTRLYSQLSLLDRRVIYMDTDSIIYEYDPEKYNIPEGQYLGEWESETKTLIKEIVSTGAKTYAYETMDGKSDLKCKGITLNAGNSVRNGVTFSNYKKLVFEKLDSIKTEHNLRFNLTKDGIFSGKINKKLVLTADKRVRINLYETLPFGHESLESLDD